MKRNLRLIAFGLATVVAAAATAQQWTGECIDPANTTPYTNPQVSGISNQLMGITVGLGGTANLGDTDSDGFPCWSPSRTLNFAGGFSFGVGGTGSAQTVFDNGMAYTMGWPGEPMEDFSYASVTVDSDDPPPPENHFGEGGFNLFFVGLSKRYFQAGWALTDTQIILEAKNLADAVRMRFRLFNNGTDAHSLGLYWASWPAMRSGQVDETGSTQFNASTLATLSGIPKSVNNYYGFNYLPDGRPLRTEVKRHLTKPDFPVFIKSMAGQLDAYGLRYDNMATPSTPDATTADLVKFGNYTTTSRDNNITVNLFGDPTGTVDTNDIGIPEPVVLQRYPGAAVQPGASRDIVFYMRSAWSVGDYFDPYTAIVDLPRAVNHTTAGTGPNPFTARLWIDNQYATIEKEVTLFNVTCTINLPAGLSLAPGEPQVKVVQSISPNAIIPIDWQVVSDGLTYGDLPVSISIETLPGPTKTLTTSVRVASQPIITLQAGPNLMTLPYQFGDSSFDLALGLTSGLDYVAYQWDATLRAYQPVQNFQRGLGYWIVPSSAHANLALNGAVVHPDTPGGGLLVSVKKGWNLIGNPYNYGFPISQMIGVAEDNPSDSLTWKQLVANEFINSALTYFLADSSMPGGGTYAIEPTDDPIMQPHRAYWVFVTTDKPIRLIFPPLFQETMPGSFRSNSTVWTQTEKQWRLQLAARSESGVDTGTYVGVMADKAKARLNQVPKAPTAPNAALTMAVIDDYKGEPTRLAQAVSDRVGKKEWKLEVQVETPGNVTVTWPNLPSLPRSLRARLVDDATGEKRDLRSTSSYTFNAAKAGTRSFTLTVEPGGSSKPVIGNVLVKPAGRDANSPVVVSYALSADALVSVRILSGTGKEVYTVTRGRADNAGENSITWALRDNANRAVAPGTYTVEILAETPNGERVRKLVPVNVIR